MCMGSISKSTTLGTIEIGGAQSEDMAQSFKYGGVGRAWGYAGAGKIWSRKYVINEVRNKFQAYPNGSVDIGEWLWILGNVELCHRIYSRKEKGLM